MNRQAGPLARPEAMTISDMHPRDQVLEIMDRIYRHRMTTTSGGNVSIRDESGDIWITPARVDKGALRRDDVVRVRSDGSSEGLHRPSSEFPFHQAIYAARPDLTAVFVFNDMMALGAIGALRARGLHVPEDISIVSYDNIAYTSMFEPALTTIAQPIAAMGQECIAQLIERIDQPNKQPGQITLSVELIERAGGRQP